MAKRFLLSAAAVLVAFSAFSFGTAAAEPVTPSPVPPAPATSTTDELVDMVMDAIQHEVPTPAPVPPS